MIVKDGDNSWIGLVITHRLNVTVCNRIHCKSVSFTFQTKVHESYYLHLKQGRGTLSFSSSSSSSSLDIEQGQVIPCDLSTSYILFSCHSAYHCMYMVWQKNRHSPGIWTAFNHQSIYSLASFSPSPAITTPLDSVDLMVSEENDYCHPLVLPSLYQSIEFVVPMTTSIPLASHAMIDEDRNCLAGRSWNNQQSEYIIRVHTMDGKFYDQTIRPQGLGM